MTVKDKAQKFVAAIDEAELAVRLLEAAGRMTRPLGATAVQALINMDDEDREQWMRCARAAMLYWGECIQNMQRPS